MPSHKLDTETQKSTRRHSAVARLRKSRCEQVPFHPLSLYRSLAYSTKIDQPTKDEKKPGVRYKPPGLAKTKLLVNTIASPFKKSGLKHKNVQSPSPKPEARPPPVARRSGPNSQDEIPQARARANPKEDSARQNPQKMQLFIVRATPVPEPVPPSLPSFYLRSSTRTVHRMGRDSK